MNLKRHHVLYGFLAVSLMIALLVFIVPKPDTMSFKPPVRNTATTSAGTSGSQMQYEVVTTVSAQERGLSGRASIPENYGMLFVFSEAQNLGFWMKDMLTPIDILWLKDDGTVVGIEDSVSPDTYPEAFYPPEPVRFVLETKAGEARRKGWTVGTKIDLPLPY